MNSSTLSLALLLGTCGVWTLGCGDTVVEDVLPAGGGGAGGSGATGGTGGDGAGGSGGSGGADGCEAYHDEQSSHAVTVRFVNDSGLPIYLPAHCGLPSFELTPLEGDDGVSYAFDPFCLQTCEDLQSEGIIDCAACAPSSILLPAGGTYDVVWDGTGLLPVDHMPDSCWHMPGAQTGCPQIVAAPAGSYRAWIIGRESCGAGCSCDAEGLCDGDVSGMEAYPDNAMVSFPAENLLEVVFGVCAFPCPSSSS